ncbi:hypothetical protein RHMOL_Rhmol08G0178900 [Rhododendron molle]|uniref:Uncharacterized protein n=1 Tax=Rhododendron molle TaxID=49168 RepID=A0ACC0MPV9_RHOML|nr:hypothetical protein RHMOL_Rhmol08G0178900 [Rhododendron molle]
MLTMDHQAKGYGRPNISSAPISSDVFEPTTSSFDDSEAKQRATVVDWLNNILPNLSLPTNASDKELRAYLSDGTVLCQILNKLRPGSVIECGGYHPSESRSDNVKRFLAAMDEMQLPRFQMSDLEKGYMKIVLQCLLTLRAHFMPNGGGCNLSSSSSPNKSGNDVSMSWKLLGQTPGGNASSRDEVSPQAYTSTLSGEDRRKAASNSKFQRALRSPVMAEPSAALIHHVGHKFHEVFQLKQGCYADLPAAKISEMMKSNSLDNAPTQSLLSVVNGILDESVERKNSEIPHQSNLFKAREEKYQSRIKVLEALATGTNEESQTEKTKIEEKKRVEEQDVIRLVKEKEQINNEIWALKQELETARKSNEESCLRMENEGNKTQEELEERLKEVMHLLTESRSRVKELEAYSESKDERLNKKETIYQRFTDFQLTALQELKIASQTIKQDTLKIQKSYSDKFLHLGTKLKALADSSQNYYAILAENRKLHNEVQELKGNIRVYCRIRPFLPGQKEKQSIIDSLNEYGDLTIANPSKQGKDGQRSFKFNKVYGPEAAQAEVYSDIQPLIRSVLDGYNACIFAYGQTGSGKTHTMTGPDGASKEEWGVNYRALDDLFNISQTRSRIFTYELGVQMVEIYNEQVRDLLSSDVELMEMGLKNRAKGATALNERSSRSHSVLTIHVRGTDAKNGTSLRGSLHLVDLAGSERVDRSEVTGDRLKEAQHINKSLSALGDVIFALAQKSTHIPYRNSKLTQVLQTSLGGHAKTLMFVQLNPELSSYSETLSTLKFAERVSGVELGAAKTNKEGRDVRDLMEQVASLKDTIAKRDEEIERLQLLKDLKNVYPAVNGEKHSPSSIRP